MLNISGLKEGFVLDHIQAGRSMDIYFKLGQDAEKNHKCHPLQEPALHYLDRAGASAYLLSRG